VVDYFSRYLEIAYLNSLTSDTVIGKFRNILARWGIPEELVTDNGGQFVSESSRQFSRQYGFKHTTTNPHYPQANGEAESAVKIAKRILQDNVFIAHMAYRSEPVN
jgi:transposase InsO family protein